MDNITKVKKARRQEDLYYMIGVSSTGLTNDLFISGEYKHIRNAKLQFFQMCLILNRLGSSCQIQLSSNTDSDKEIIYNIKI